MESLELHIWGERFRLTTSYDAEFVQRVADYLNEKIREEQENDSNLVSTKIAALRVAFKVVAENLLIQQRVNKLELDMNALEDELNIPFESI